MATEWTPTLEEDETILVHHEASATAFWRAMRRPAVVFFLVLTLPFLLFHWIYPDNMPWLLIILAQIMVWVPIAVGLALERASLRNYETYVTNRRILNRLLGDLPLKDAPEVDVLHRGVRMHGADGERSVELFYPDDPESLADAVKRAGQAAA